VLLELGLILVCSAGREGEGNQRQDDEDEDP
jgi:hypothetical protein